MQGWQQAVAYHQRTKHHFHRFAASSGFLDWANQPDPFRRFASAPLLRLGFSDPDRGPPYDDLYVPGKVPPRCVDADSLSAFLEHSLALSAWKQYQDSSWSLRINPSSGNLHPTEGYVVLPPVVGLSDAPGVYHYAPGEHALERRAEFGDEGCVALFDGFPPGTFFAGLTSIHWREAWKYGERAYRYCQHDVGHALAALALAAVASGWCSAPLSDLGDAEVAALLGLDRDGDFTAAEREHADLLLAVFPGPAEPGGTAPALPRRPDAAGMAGIASRARWTGQANRLSTEHVDWEAIDEVTAACAKEAETGSPPPPPGHSFAPAPAPSRPLVPARRVIRQRRSARALDGRTRISAEQFYLILDRVLPRFRQAPWCAVGPPAHVHLVLFVHRVDDLPPGLYFLVRDPGKLAALRAAMSHPWSWDAPAGCPAGLPLYHLTTGDARRVAGQVSCGQEIAADGVFSCGMIAEFEAPLREHGAWYYRRLFWETGVIGQVLYLEAEAAGIRGTGIGCFFDDPVHDLLGLSGTAFQSLYHFTMGGPVEDKRLTTRPPYGDRQERADGPP
ncbi:MAG: SagB/ThcOx family dehydrogenase [Planctomycetes bacterium]|nr:SagB/ThcOx family dehydrogenase [Planctomycetota bacterium]